MVEVDKLGQTIAVAPVDRAKGVDPRVIHAAMAAFVQSVRMVTPDVALQRKAIFGQPHYAAGIGAKNTEAAKIIPPSPVKFNFI